MGEWGSRGDAEGVLRLGDRFWCSIDWPAGDQKAKHDGETHEICQSGDINVLVVSYAYDAVNGWRK